MAIIDARMATDGGGKTPGAPTIEGTNYLRAGSKGESVKSLQDALISLGYDVGGSGADGIFGQKTAAALSEFQKKNGLTSDSIYGQQSASALQKALNAGSAPNPTRLTDKGVNLIDTIKATGGGGSAPNPFAGSVASGAPSVSGDGRISVGPPTGGSTSAADMFPGLFIPPPPPPPPPDEGKTPDAPDMPGETGTTDIIPTEGTSADVPGGTPTTGTTETGPSKAEEAINNMIAELTNMINQQNQYLEDLKGMEFDYNPATDPTFLRDAATLENTVTQMMLGRGGMYSSVAQSALQSRLASLQIDYTQMKYDEFKGERAYKMDLAQMEQNRKNTYFNQVMDMGGVIMQQEKWRVEQEQMAWANQWKQVQYEQDLIDQQLNRQFAIESRNMAIADAMAQKQMQIQAMENEENMDIVRTKVAVYTGQRKALDAAMATWTSKEKADYSVHIAFDRLGITVPIGARYGEYTNQINAAENKLYKMELDVRRDMASMTMDSEYLSMINDLLYPQPIQTGTKVTTTVDSEAGETVRVTTPMYGDEKLPNYSEDFTGSEVRGSSSQNSQQPVENYTVRQQEAK